MIDVYPELSAVYALVSPLGDRAVFNNPSDPDYVGVLTDHSGFDSPEIREEAENRPAMDGGLNGPFLFGRRPMTMTVKVLNPASQIERGARVAKLQNVVLNCLRDDGVLSWTLSNGQSVYTRVRCQSPLRLSGAWQKEFLIGMVAEDPHFFSVVSKRASSADPTGELGDRVGMTFPFRPPLAFDAAGYPDIKASVVSVVNDGTATTYPVVMLDYASAFAYTYVLLQNLTTGEYLKFNSGLVGPTSLRIDFSERTITGPAAANRYGVIDTVESTWWGLVPGVNRLAVRLVSTTFGYPTFSVNYRDAWL